MYMWPFNGFMANFLVVGEWWHGADTWINMILITILLLSVDHERFNKKYMIDSTKDRRLPRFRWKFWKSDTKGFAMCNTEN